jgi:hypothetical protein
MRLLTGLIDAFSKQAPAQTIVDMVKFWANDLDDVDAFLEVAGWLTGEFKDILPGIAPPTSDEAKRIFDAAGGDTKLIQATLELIKWRRDNNKSTSDKFIGMLINMLRKDDKAELLRKGQQIRRRRLNPGEIPPQNVTPIRPAAKPAPQPAKPAAKPAAKPTPKPASPAPIPDPMAALQAALGGSNVDLEASQAALVKRLQPPVIPDDIPE